jgi:hypothetical protein
MTWRDKEKTGDREKVKMVKHEDSGSGGRRLAAEAGDACWAASSVVRLAQGWRAHDGRACGIRPGRPYIDGKASSSRSSATSYPRAWATTSM